MASFKAKFPVLQELFAKNHRGGGLWGPPAGRGLIRLTQPSINFGTPCIRQPEGSWSSYRLRRTLTTDTPDFPSPTAVCSNSSLSRLLLVVQKNENKRLEFRQKMIAKLFQLFARVKIVASRIEMPKISSFS